ncbi:sarcosine oxidase [Pseudomonas amygdali pv. tabaci str. ATCC 11528]|uniref:Sarcosine oxidase, subunit gamma protein n=4 Tax=Pseudomonas amygdali TaxID=47877 RepID=A0A3M6I7Y9_PSEAJ|nr:MULTISPECIES: sarcosine oxidase [Pseudomonas syringae group]ARA81324.1 sarcosine oxidase [Pseudomonas amygdali pv. lachrymans]AXH56806.1 sarcosine oxidase [Pseudomonas amygdali pv. lachrymans str. M301315]KEZ65508.1 sarcosine oxidase [Pseudomonas amygdali pv. tabaci str. ATCC 11528]KKY54025.1 sarcosine oxidase [Pseudomonas amygdali pv. tabaci str. ATCC 11528]KKY58263.1 sarcosine oxidase [Pseudomonas amygdali pv. lachrymans]
MTSLIQDRPVRAGAPSLCTLQDLTDLPRVGFRGTQSAEYLTARGFSLPDTPNRAVTQADGSHVARLSQTEYLLLGSPLDKGQRIADEEARWELDHNANYLLPREDSHAWLQLSGPCIPEVMAKLCGVDLRPSAFAVGSVAQTSAARINVIVINVGAQSEPCFQILFDRASLAYFKEAMLDAMTEFGGRLS